MEDGSVSDVGPAEAGTTPLAPALLHHRAQPPSPLSKETYARAGNRRNGTNSPAFANFFPDPEEPPERPDSLIA
jgi:hypothetical protein